MQSISQERSDSISKPYLILPYKSELYESFRKYPKSRLLFVTIRDAKCRYDMNKAINWIKKHCDTLCIVRGLAGGEHFHLLAGLTTTTWVPKGSKGVHFRLDYVSQDHKTRVCPSDMEVQDILYAKHIKQLRTDNLIERLNVPTICVRIGAMIADYHRLNKARSKRLESKNKKEKEIINILNYLEVNLNENKSITRYVTSYEKFPLNTMRRAGSERERPLRPCLRGD